MGFATQDKKIVHLAKYFINTDSWAQWDFVQLFSESQKFFHTGIVLALLFYPASANLSIIACKENFQNAGNGCRKSHAILSVFMQPGPVELFTFAYLKL